MATKIDKVIYQAHATFAKLPWKRLVEPAAALAKDGFAVTPRLAWAIETALPHLSPAAKSLFAPGERPSARARSSCSPTSRRNLVKASASCSRRKARRSRSSIGADLWFKPTSTMCISKSACM